MEAGRIVFGLISIVAFIAILVGAVVVNTIEYLVCILYNLTHKVKGRKSK